MAQKLILHVSEWHSSRLCVLIATGCMLVYTFANMGLLALLITHTDYNMCNNAFVLHFEAWTYMVQKAI